MPNQRLRIGRSRRDPTADLYERGRRDGRVEETSRLDTLWQKRLDGYQAQTQSHIRDLENSARENRRLAETRDAQVKELIDIIRMNDEADLLANQERAETALQGVGESLPTSRDEHPITDPESVDSSVMAILKMKRKTNPDEERSDEEQLRRLKEFQDHNVRTSGIKTNHTPNLDYVIAPGVTVSVERGTGLGYDLLFLFAKLAQQLLKGVLRYQRGTLVLDPISYINSEVGVFVKNGSSVDAVKMASILRSKAGLGRGRHDE